MNQKMNPVDQLAFELEKLFATGKAREHAYRPSLVRLFESFPGVTALNDPARSDYGNPDFVFLDSENSDVTLGYGEAKDIGESLDKSFSGQIERYLKYSNFLLTNGLDWRFYRNGELTKQVTIGFLEFTSLSFQRDRFKALELELLSFFTGKPEPIRSPAKLARILAGSASRIREEVLRLLSDEQRSTEGAIDAIYVRLKSELVHDLNPSSFADLYAQTLVYGLFAARHEDKNLETFSRQEARDLVPDSNPFLKVFFDHIAGAGFEPSLAYIVNELCRTLVTTDVRELLDNPVGSRAGYDDPVVHFYEDFLTEYDPNLRMKLGAVYTPTALVDFLVDRVDRILIENFGIQDGLANIEKNTEFTKVSVQGETSKKQFHAVQILDPATGTGTFLNQVLKKVLSKISHSPALLEEYVHSHLIPRLHGLELMMAPYTVAHLKLAHTLSEFGVSARQRFGIYLTNALEADDVKEPDLLNSLGIGGAISVEASLAAKVKREVPVMVVLGNPPYSGFSDNKTDFAAKMIARYKFEGDGVTPLKEKKHRLDDDYVKFIGLAETLILRRGQGVMAYVVNHGFIDNASYRGFRARLLETFDHIEVIDLHGNVVKRASTNGPDENVFPIKQGVALLVAFRLQSGEKNRSAKVFHGELFGTRKEKFESLQTGLELVEVDIKSPLYNFNGNSRSHSGLTFDQLFNSHTSGIQTSRDGFSVDFNPDALRDRLEKFRSSKFSDEQIRSEFFPSRKTDSKFLSGDTRGWKLASARIAAAKLGVDQLQVTYCYRPLDNRHLANPEVFADWPRTKVMQNVGHNRPAIILGREGKAVGPGEWNLVYATQHPSDLNIFYRGGGLVFPLWVGQSEVKTHNFNEAVLEKFLGDLQFSSIDDLQEFQNFKAGIVGPRDVFNFIYGILHSSAYRTKFKADLEIGLPPLARTKDLTDYYKVAELGKLLLDLHLSEVKSDGMGLAVRVQGSGNNVMEEVRFESPDRVHFNKTQCFEGVPLDAFVLKIGGYQPLEKFLADRKGSILSYEQVVQYDLAVYKAMETLELRNQLDYLSPEDIIAV